MSDSPEPTAPTGPTGPVLDPVKVERKLRMMEGLFLLAYNTKKEQLRRRHPELSERELNHRAYALIERGCR